MVIFLALETNGFIPVLWLLFEASKMVYKLTFNVVMRNTYMGPTHFNFRSLRMIVIAVNSAFVYKIRRKCRLIFMAVLVLVPHYYCILMWKKNKSF